MPQTHALTALLDLHFPWKSTVQIESTQNFSRHADTNNIFSKQSMSMWGRKEGIFLFLEMKHLDMIAAPLPSTNMKALLTTLLFTLLLQQLKPLPKNAIYKYVCSKNQTVNFTIKELLIDFIHCPDPFKLDLLYSWPTSGVGKIKSEELQILVVHASWLMKLESTDVYNGNMWAETQRRRRGKMKHLHGFHIINSCSNCKGWESKWR